MNRSVEDNSAILIWKHEKSLDKISKITIIIHY